MSGPQERAENAADTTDASGETSFETTTDTSFNTVNNSCYETDYARIKTFIGNGGADGFLEKIGSFSLQLCWMRA